MSLIYRKVNMAMTIFVAVIGGSILLFAATLALVVLNWSEKLGARFARICLCRG